MVIFKVLGFIASTFLLVGTIMGLYHAGKNEGKLINRFELPTEMREKIRFEENDQRFQIKFQKINWYSENVTATSFEPVENPCQIFWIMTLDSRKANKYLNLKYLNPSSCQLNKAEIFYIQYKVLRLISKQYDFKKIDKILLDSSFHLEELANMFPSAKVVIEAITDRKLKRLNSGVFALED